MFTFCPGVPSLSTGISSNDGNLSVVVCCKNETMLIIDRASGRIAKFISGQFQQWVCNVSPSSTLLATSCKDHFFTLSYGCGSHATIQDEYGEMIGPQYPLAPTSAAASSSGSTLLLTVPTFTPRPGYTLVVLQKEAKNRGWSIRMRWVAPWAEVLNISPDGSRGLIVARSSTGRTLLEIKICDLRVCECTSCCCPVAARYLDSDLIQVTELIDGKFTISIWSNIRNTRSCTYSNRLVVFSDARYSILAFDYATLCKVVSAPTMVPKLVAPTERINIPLRDYVIKYMSLTVNISEPEISCGDIIYLSGGPGGFVYPGYSPLITNLVRQGWRVHQPALCSSDSNSRPFGEKWGVEDLVELKQYIDHILKQHDMPVVVFGHSYGSLLALRWATQKQSDRCAVVLWGVILSVSQLWDETPSSRHLLLQYYKTVNDIYKDNITVSADALQIRTLLIVGGQDQQTPLTASIERFICRLKELPWHRCVLHPQLGHWSRLPEQVRYVCDDIHDFIFGKE